MNQAQFIHDYADQSTEQFNKLIFTRSDEKIVESLQNIILSCERDGYVMIKVKKFTLITEYSAVRQKLREYEDMLLAKPSSRSKGPQDNRYSYIDMKESDVYLLVVDYHIASHLKDPNLREDDDLQVLICIPKVVDKFYFKINGSMYSAMFQIVDASTYNTSTSKSSTKHYITLKCMFQPIRIFRNIMTLKTTKGEEVECCTYDNNTFSKSVPVALYFFAKFGFYKALSFIGCYGAIFLSKEDIDDPDLYVFNPKKGKIFICVAKMIFDKNQVVQHFVYALTTVFNKTTEYEDPFSSLDFWKVALGLAFNNQTNPLEKGKGIINSLELVYDLETKKEIHLPEEYKHDVYCILRWMIWEYNNLRIKNNLNILTKKLRCSEYIASLYGAKLSRGIYRLSDKGKNADLKAIRRVLITNPMFLINQMSRNQLVNFRGMVTDMDSLLAMKFTYKGESGMNKAISGAYKLIHPSNLGVLDPDASSPSDPGTSGSVAPMVPLYDGTYFSHFQEPITWEKEYAQLYDSYVATKGLKEVMNFKQIVLKDKSITAQDMINAEIAAEQARRLVSAIPLEAPEYGGLPLEGSGTIQYV